jgi:aquaporin Z
MKISISRHWPEYLMEAAELGIFMVSAAAFSVILEHPDSALHSLLPDPFIRRALIGLAMGLTAICIIYSPWGKQSGAHFNPAVTLTFLRLGRIQTWDAVFYCIAQFLGGLAGMFITGVFLGGALAHPSIRYAITVPGPYGPLPAFIAETIISFFLMSVILRISNTDRYARYTGLFAGSLVALYVAFEAPLSGMSMNPARTLGSAVPAHLYTALWLYFVAPPLGMLAAGEFHKKRGLQVACAKLHHHHSTRCIFCSSRAEHHHDAADHPLSNRRTYL